MSLQQTNRIHDKTDAARRRALADATQRREHENYLDALEEEREGYKRLGKDDRVSSVNEEIKRVKREISNLSDEPVGRTADVTVTVDTSAAVASLADALVAQNAEPLIATVGNLDDEQLAAVKAAEERGESRSTVLEAITRRQAELGDSDGGGTSTPPQSAAEKRAAARGGRGRKA